jgi:hypothetical protein
MSQKPQIDPAFQKLLVKQPVQPFYISDLFNHLSDCYADALLLLQNADKQDANLSDTLSALQNDADTSKAAMQKLLDIRKAGDAIVYLDVTKTLPEQILQCGVTNTPINQP